MIRNFSNPLIISLLLPAFSSSLFAEEVQEVADTTKPTPSFVDKTHQYLNGRFSLPAIWFDKFFADESISEDVDSNTEVNWYNDIYQHQTNGLSFKTKLNARVYLPKISHRFKLIFESEDDDPFLTPEANKATEEKGELGLRYDISKKKRSGFNIKVTLRPGIEARYRYNYPLAEHFTARFIEKIYQKVKVTGVKSQLDLDYQLTPIFLLRLGNWGKWETDINDFTTGSSLTLYQYISPKKAINYSAGMSALHAPYSHIDNTYLSLTYRQNILKKWFFYEIKPKVNWNKTPGAARVSETSIVLRLEVLFSGV